MKKLLIALFMSAFLTSPILSSAEDKPATPAAAAETADKKAEDKPAETTATDKPAEKTGAKEGDKKADDKATGDKKAEAQPAKKMDLENTLIMTLKDGKVVIELRPDLAPNHVARIKELTREGFYDGIVFHRVIESFMAQTGDPTGTGRGGSGKNLKAEFSAEKHVRGTLSMARANDPDSADSQFFIVFQEAPHLDGNYTIFGKVTEGMEFVDKIKKGYGPNGTVTDPDKMISLKVAADVDYSELPESLKGSTTPDAKKAGEAPKDPNVVGEKTETKTNPDGSIDVIKTTVKKEELPAGEKDKGTKELAPKAVDPNSGKPASQQ